MALILFGSGSCNFGGIILQSADQWHQVLHWASLLGCYWRRHWGSFADLAYRATKHPAMLTYLDNIYSVGENSPKAQNARRNNSKIQIGLNDNLARELMELHTISPAAGYTEVDIREAAKIPSGWGIIFNKPIKGKGNWNGTTDYENIYVPSHAEPGNKTVLGERFSSGKGALRKLVNFLSERPETRTFICRKLCLHFVSDTPSADDLRHVEQAWQAKG